MRLEEYVKLLGLALVWGYRHSPSKQYRQFVVQIGDADFVVEDRIETFSGVGSTPEEAMNMLASSIVGKLMVVHRPTRHDYLVPSNLITDLKQSGVPAMAKAKKKYRLDEEEKAHIWRSIDTELVHRIECWACGRESELNGGSALDAAGCFLMDGWRWRVSDEFQTAGVVCRSCAKKTDEELAREDD